jgi:hypothetical protein
MFAWFDRLQHATQARPRLSIVLAAGASCLFLNLWYLTWPKAISFDVTFGMAIARNAAVTGHWLSAEPNNIITGDLSLVKPQWLNTWPFGIPLLFFVLLKLGLTPGGVAFLVAALCPFATATGWALLLRQLGTGTSGPVLVALLLPWTSFLTFALTNLFNDHLAVAAMPWALLLLTGLPSGEALRSLHAWPRTLAAALAVGSMIFLKYSAFPLVGGGGLYFLTREKLWPRLRAVIQALPFGAALGAPVTLLYAINVVNSGQVSALLREGLQLNAIGLRQIWNVLGPPMSVVVGWERFATLLPPTKILCDAFGAAILLLTIVTIWRMAESAQARRLWWLCLVMTLSVQVFLLALTIVYGNYADWTAEPRYYYPIFIGWLAFCILALVSARTPKVLRLSLGVLCAVPFAYVAAAALAKPVVRKPPPVLPVSRLAWIGPAEDLAAIPILREELRRHPPRFLIGETLLADELLVPTLPWFSFRQLPVLWSSQPLTFWATLDPADTADLRRRLQKARVETIPLSSRLTLSVVHLE